MVAHNPYNKIEVEKDEDAQASGCCELLTAEKDEVIQRLRGQLQNCVNHLDRAKRKGYGGNFDDCIESANRALYETLSS